MYCTYYIYFIGFICVIAPVVTSALAARIDGTIKTRANNCEDKVPDCKQYGKPVCDDPQYFRWVYDYCAKFCDMCRYLDQDRITYPSPTKAACVDEYPYCKMYVSACSLSTYNEWINGNCRKTCGLCHDTPTSKHSNVVG